MKKYKLIKEYPGCPGLGYYASFCTRRGTWIISSSLDQADILYTINNLDPKKYPDFWQEFIEKDYEILSFKGVTSGQHYIKISDNLYSGNHTLENMLKVVNSKDFIIYSIKRLSDGEVFTIGDLVTHDKSRKECIGLIDSFGFSITKDKSLFISYEGASSPLKYVDLIKKPLFKTEDGVDIFEGDVVYRVNKSDFDLWSESGKLTFGYSYNYLNNGVWHFSTVKAAKEYIIQNKPYLSLNDIIPYINPSNQNSLFTKVSILKELIKSKL